MSVINSIPLIAAGDDGYQISRSVRLRSSASAYFNRTPASAGSLTTWTLSGWVKRGALTSGGNFTLFSAGSAAQPYTLISFTSDQLAFDCINAGSVVVGRRYTNQVFRDPSAWYHLVFVWDTTNATAASRMRMYVNGVQVTSFSLSSDPALNATTQANTTAAHYFGEYPAGGNYLDGYLTEINFIDGQALTPSSFGETDSITGVWKPKKYAGTYGTNGFFLNFSDNSAATAAAIGKDYSGNGNNWTPNNISVTSGVTYDSMLDTPTPYADGGDGRGNYCTINPFQMAVSGPLFSLSSGNLNYSCSASSGNAGRMYSRGTMALHSGKTYWEVKVTSTNCGIGICNDAQMTDNGGGSLKSLMLFNTTQAATNTTATYTGTTFSFTTNDVIGFAFDGTAMTLGCYKNNTLIGTWSGIDSTVTWIPLFGVNASGSSTSMEANFGQRPFTYTPPTGFKALNTQNLPESTIKKGNTYFDATTYTGTGSALSITNTASFQPDLVWIKGRSGATNHALYDAVRGTTLDLVSNSTAAETTQATGLTAFNSNGFTVGALAKLNTSSSTYVGWQWKESASAGFDIVTYTGNGTARTIAHSLGVKPSMIILKNRSGAYDWPTWHQYLPNPTTQHFWLNATNAAQVSGSFNSTQPTSSVFSVGTTSEANANGNNFVAYLFAEVSGFSKFGSYTGNGSTDGTFVYCGFRPRFILAKASSGVADWVIVDTARDTYNGMQNQLFPDTSGAESSGTIRFDALSNGFKLRVASDPNSSGVTYIYAAFAENPFKNSLAR